MAPLRDLRRTVEKRLYARGFSSPEIRRLLTTQIILTGAVFLAGMILAPLSVWPLTFSAGAALATYSLWHIARFGQAVIFQEFSAALGIRLFAGFTLRLVIIGVVLFGLIIRLEAPLAPLLLGLGSTVLSIALWGLTRFFRKTVKEE